MSKIVNYDNVFDVWEALARSYAFTSNSRQIELWGKLRTIKKYGLTTEDFISKFKEICDQLSTIGFPVSPREHILYLCNGLGAEYNSIVTGISFMIGEPTLKDIHSKLMSYDYRLKLQNGSEYINFPQARAFRFQKEPSMWPKEHPTKPILQTFLSSTSTHVSNKTN